MQIEVLPDKYGAAIEAMQEKIRNGSVPGISDPGEAKNIVRKGHLTYEQTKNIAKAGTIESLTYDAVNGVIITSTAFGATAVITSATNLWSGEDFNKSLKMATYSGLKVEGAASVTTTVADQLSKAGLNNALVGSFEVIVRFMGPKASAVLINTFRSGGRSIYGSAATKSAAKLLRDNTITVGVIVIVLSSFDIANIFQGRISGKQMFKNLVNTATTVAGGTGDWLGEAAVGSTILPGVGMFVGGLIGAIAVGGVAGKATGAVLGDFIEEDAEEMVKIIQEELEKLANGYLLNQKEVEKSVDKLSDILDGMLLEGMFASNDRRVYAREMLIPTVERETKKHKHAIALTDAQMMMGLREVLEEISDSSQNQKNIVTVWES